MKTPLSPTAKTVLKIVALVLICVPITFLILCPFLNIHVTSYSLTGEYVERVERINGYYVVIYCHDVWYTEEDGDGTLTFGYADENTEYLWKQRELSGVVPYRRFLCFSREAVSDLESYTLSNESGTKQYGGMYVLRTPGGEIYYYYYRELFVPRTESSPIPFQETITFSYEGTTYELKDHYRFSSDVDFTDGSHVLYIEDEPCYFHLVTKE